MKIYTSYYGNIKKLDAAGILPIGISVGKPKWITSYMPFVKKLAPNYNFLGKEYDDYKSLYLAKLNSQHWGQIEQEIKAHSHQAGGKDVALCCFEKLEYLKLGQPLDKDNDWCHRTMMADYVNELVGTELITEWSDKPKAHYVQLSMM